ncbi:MAG: hypothetical protein ACTHPD_00525 [Rhizomicrobium sp.]
MRANLFAWAGVLAAFPRTKAAHTKMQAMSYYERLRYFNSTLGADWCFRLLDLVGPETISSTRPSWLDFYRDDVYDLHLPLDPRAPETDKYLGADMGGIEFAFYTGMGFEGYALALQTPRYVDVQTGLVRLGGYTLDLNLREQVSQLSGQTLGPEAYYAAYGQALSSLMTAIDHICRKEGDVSDDRLEEVAAASLLFLCGGHQGCSAHIDEAEAQDTRLKVIILCKYVIALAEGSLKLRLSALQPA